MPERAKGDTERETVLQIVRGAAANLLEFGRRAKEDLDNLLGGLFGQRRRMEEQEESEVQNMLQQPRVKRGIRSRA